MNESEKKNQETDKDGSFSRIQAEQYSHNLVTEENFTYAGNFENVCKLLEDDENDNRYSELSKIFNLLHYSDQAEIINNLTQKERVAIWQNIYNSIKPEVLTVLSSNLLELILHIIGFRLFGLMVTNLSIQDAILCLESFSDSDKIEIMRFCSSAQRKELKKLLSYPEDSAGRIMDPNIIMVKPESTLEEVCAMLRKNRHHIPERIYNIFAINELGEVIGQINTTTLLSSDEKLFVKDILEENFFCTSADTDRKEIIYLFNKYNITSMIVNDANNKPVGIICVDDVQYLIDDASKDDILHLGGIINAGSIHQGVFSTAKSRFIWLIANLITAALASFVVGLFGDNFKVITALAVLMPIVASMGGNAGIQTVTVTIRALAMKEINQNTIMRFFNKEVLVSIINGAAFAVIGSACVGLYYQNLGLGIVLGVALLVNLLAAALAGTFIPILVEKLKGDPAVISTVFLTTITDIVGFGCFLWLAKVFLI